MLILEYAIFTGSNEVDEMFNWFILIMASSSQTIQTISLKPSLTEYNSDFLGNTGILFLFILGITWYFLLHLERVSSKIVVWKIFEGEMLIRILGTTLIQIFCNSILYSQVIVKSTLDPDDHFWRNVSMNGLNVFPWVLPKALKGNIAAT